MRAASRLPDAGNGAPLEAPSAFHRSPSSSSDRDRQSRATPTASMQIEHPESGRKRLPNRRAHELLDFEHGGFRFTAGIGRFPDGRLAEIFLNGAKIGTPIDVNARDAAIVASLALQHGAEPDELRRALTRNGDGSAGGPLAKALDLIEAGAS
jgi:hypothetical protein